MAANAAREIERSYHLVGLTDAKASPAKTTEIDKYQVFTSLVRYTNADKRMIGVVTIIPLSERVFTVTVTNPVEGSTFSESDLTALTSSLHITADAGTLAAKDETSKDSRSESISWIAGPAGLVLFAGGLLLLLLRYAKRRKQT